MKRLNIKDLEKGGDMICPLHEHIQYGNVFNWTKAYSEKTTFYPSRNRYGLFAVAKTLEDISKNKRYFKGR